MSDVLEKHIMPNGCEVLYNDETHQYFVNGQQLPSITQLVSAFCGNSYSGVNPETLKRAADYGTKIHNILSTTINKRLIDPTVEIPSDFQEVTSYFQLVEPIYKISPIMTEKVVVLYCPTMETPVACGRFDLLCTVDEFPTLIDFKTTSTILRPQVTTQLNLYLTAASQSGYLSNEEEYGLGVVHLSGEKGRFIPIPKLNPNFYHTVVLKTT